MLKTPNFTNKKVSIIWMLALALTLVLVDYFLSPVMTENKWIYQKVLKVDKILINQLSCKEKIKQYSLKNREKNYLAKACLNNDALVIIKESKYKGELLVFKQGKMLRIATNIHQPSLITISSEKEIFIQEQGRERILKFFKK